MWPNWRVSVSLKKSVVPIARYEGGGRCSPTSSGWSHGQSQQQTSPKGIARACADFWTTRSPTNPTSSQIGQRVFSWTLEGHSKQLQLQGFTGLWGGEAPKVLVTNARQNVLADNQRRSLGFVQFGMGMGARVHLQGLQKQRQQVERSSIFLSRVLLVFFWFWWFVFNLTNLNLYTFLGGNSNQHQGCSDVHHLAVRDGIQGCRWAWCCRTFDGQSWHGHSNQFKVMALTLWIQPEDCTGNLWPMSRSWKREFWNHHSYLVLASAFRLANGGRLWRFCSSSLLRPCFSVTSSSWPRMHSACPELDPWLGMIFWKPWRLKLGAENLLRA